MHPVEDIRGSRSGKLAGRRIVLGITGSIAAVECVKLAREMARHGADVIPVMSRAAVQILHPDAVHFATGHEPVLELDGAVKHVELCGNSGGRADLLLIAPATANTISKMACGIDDTPVTTMATTAIGSGMPVMVVPAMHSSMYDHPVVLDNIEKLKNLGVTFVGPRLEENKAKMASQEDIVHHVIRALGGGAFRGKKVLVITGPTSEPLDDMRVLTNRATGHTGIHLALEAFHRGADVTVWAGKGVRVPGVLPVERFGSVKDLETLAGSADADIILVPAAISDFLVDKRPGKIGSADAVSLELMPAPKILDILRERTDALLVGFKAEAGIPPEELETRAVRRMREHGLHMIVANLLEDVGEDRTRAVILRGDGERRVAETGKEELAAIIFDMMGPGKAEGGR